MDNKSNILLALVLTLAILFGWPYISKHFLPQFEPAATQSAPADAAGAANAPVAQDNGQPTTATQGNVAPVASAGGKTRSIADALKDSPRINIDTPRLRGTIALKGARINDIVLPTYRQTIAKDSPPVRLFAPSGTEHAYFASFGWSGTGLKLPDANTLWTADRATLTPQTPVTLSWNNGQGQTFRIRLSVDENYMLNVDQTVVNEGTAAVNVRPFGYISRRGPSHDVSTWTIHTGPIGVFDGSADYSVDYKTLNKKGTQHFTTTGGWIGFTDKYWHSALIPAQNLPVSAEFRTGGPELYQADMSYASKQLAPGQSTTTASRLFVGAKETNLLEQYTNKGGVELFDRAIDWGWFRWFEKPIFYVLDWLFKVIGNFGVAIICLTFIVRGLMFPVAQRQFKSMAAMRVLQPKMKAIQQRHKDDKAKQQQEIMQLYRAEKVNPLAGCLPMFLQVPIFFALYKVLMLTIEMRHQPFVLWIKDLSAPDPLHVLNLFGLLPFTPPGLLAIGPLALVLGLTMFMQFQLNPAQMDPAQQKIFMFMPWMMMFVMAPFAAGLLIYWCTSNILTIAQQWWLYRQHPALRHQTATAK